jgi:predicted dithiol-disulfide oxidoreductase (DUF899 family)
MMPTHYVDESPEYRKQRDALLEAEAALRDQREAVAALRRQLPTNVVRHDYVFQEGPADLEKDAPIRETKLSELFDDDHDELLLVHFMFDPSWEKGCPMCSMWADGYDAVAKHVRERASFALVARQQILPFRHWARTRGWQNLRLLSAHDSSFIPDFGMEDEKFGQKPGVSVFRREADGTIHHAHTIDAMLDGKFRGVDLLSPVFNLFDLLPSGRGNFMPQHED